MGDVDISLPDFTHEKAKWNKRMIGTIPGIDFPEGFDELPAEEREKKLAGALEIL
jgi:hypothetical protein